MRTMLLVLCLGGCAAGAEGTPGREWPHAIAHADCAPWDGPATTIILSESPPDDSLTGPYLSITVYRSPTQAGGRTRVDDDQLQGMSARFCPGDGPCIPADAGWVDLTPGSGVLRGRYSLRLPDGRTLRGSLTAPVERGQMLCG
jgi:hypothetical protein